MQKLDVKKACSRRDGTPAEFLSQLESDGRIELAFKIRDKTFDGKLAEFVSVVNEYGIFSSNGVESMEDIVNITKKYEAWAVLDSSTYSAVGKKVLNLYPDLKSAEAARENFGIDDSGNMCIIGRLMWEE